MSVVIFTGPSLGAEDARSELDATYLPPAAQGDLYRAALAEPRVIGLIDGFFEHMPAVWHKEILWAMANGIHVFGASSMGALRAAELADFGMEGIGVIFDWYRRGVLEDDDEVAVAHGSAETGFRSISAPMVNIRATLADARAAGVIGADTHTRLIALAKAMFYPTRAYAVVLQSARVHGVAAEEIAALRDWLPDHQRNLKREDALALVRAIRARLPALGRKIVSYQFESTVFWQHGIVDAEAHAPVLQPVS